jgi:agmatine deiminase
MLDGGNVVKWTDKVIMTQKVIVENPGWERRNLVADLRELLEVDKIVLIPPEPGDVTGHADGVVRFVDGETVVANDYRGVDRDYRRLLLRTLKGSGLEIVEIPYRPESDSSGWMPSAVVNFVNFLRAASILVIPAYGLAEDKTARKILTAIVSTYSAKALGSRELARDGGVLNCCTWAMKSPMVLWPVIT